MRGIQERKYLILLAFLIILLAVQPLGHGTQAGLFIYDAFVAALLLAAFFIVFERRRERVASLVLVLAGLSANWASYGLAGQPQVILWVIYHCLVSVFLLFTIAVILRGLFQQRTIRADHVLGALCGYLLAGLLWGNGYLLAWHLAPGSFHVQPRLAWQLDDESNQRFLFNYFSFVTLTTLGYGDVTPIKPAAAMLACLEGVFGQFYVAVIVAQLIGLKLAQTVRQDGQKPE